MDLEKPILTSTEVIEIRHCILNEIERLKRIHREACLVLGFKDQKVNENVFERIDFLKKAHDNVGLLFEAQFEDENNE